MITDWKLAGKRTYGPTTCACSLQLSEAGSWDNLTLAAALLQGIHRVKAEGGRFYPGRGSKDGPRLGSLRHDLPGGRWWLLSSVLQMHKHDK